MGNRSSGRGGRQAGVPCVFVKLPGYLVKASICIPDAPPLALWMLAWVERLLEGATLAQLEASPPWPVPPDRLVARQLVHELIDRRWVVPDWSGGGAVVASQLQARYAAEGRDGLSRELFSLQVVPGEWWLDGTGGALLARQAAAQFDWDFKRRADHELPAPPDPQRVLDGSHVDLVDLLRKLGGNAQIQEGRDRAFLGTSLRLGQRKDILFPLYGEDRVLPDELAQLEPVLLQHAPALLGLQRRPTSPPAAPRQNPVERLAAEVEQLPLDLRALGPRELVRERIEALGAQLDERSVEPLIDWLSGSQVARPVAGSAALHFAALAEMGRALGKERPAGTPWLLLTSAFLAADSLQLQRGLIPALRQAPAGCRFLVVYGHANDDTLDAQQRDLQLFAQRLRSLDPELAARCELVLGSQRSHEKAILSSRGDWLLGSWNAASSPPDSIVFECSLTGHDPRFALLLLTKVAVNIRHPRGEAACSALADALRAATPSNDSVKATAQHAVNRLRQAVRLAESVLAAGDSISGPAWTRAVRALRGALCPLLARAQLDLIDEQQTRGVLAAYIQAARRDVLLASDRLADSALDDATLHDLKGPGPARRIVRLIWGRERGDGPLPSGHARTQHQRAAKTIREARELLGTALRTSERAMANHAKVLLTDGLRGIVTSENILSFGGEKAQSATRELGISFAGLSAARHLLGAFTAHWLAVLQPDSGQGTEPPYEWLALLLELLGTNPTSVELGAALQAVMAPTAGAEPQGSAVQHAFATLRRQLSADPMPWLLSKGEWLGLLISGPESRWFPYYSAQVQRAADTLLVGDQASGPPHIEPPAAGRLARAMVSPAAPAVRSHSLIEKLQTEMCRIPAGTFLMGDDRVARERPRHRVVITRDFLLGRTPVTQELWSQVMGSLPMLRDVERHPRFPIIYVSYADIQRFLDRLNALPGGGRFELPTEAQWEYACRAGSSSIYCFGDDPGAGERPGLLERYAWTKRNAKARLQEVGQLKPNDWGLFDMHGLVYETMRDGFRRYTAAEQRDPVGPLGNGPIVARGGAWGRHPVDPRSPEREHFRCASRQIHEASHRVSFRLACRLS